MDPLSTEHTSAAADYLTPQAAACLTRSYRDGDDDALTSLIAGLRWLAYAYWLPDSCGQLLAERPDLAKSLGRIGIDHEDWPGIAWLAICETFEGRGKGARHSESKVPDDPYLHVIAALHRAWRKGKLDIGQHIDPHIRAPHDTNSKRRKRGDEPHPDCCREQSSPEDRLINGRLASTATDPRKPPRSRTGNEYGVDIDANQIAAHEPLWLDLDDDTEKAICKLLRNGWTLREIAEHLDLTLHRVRKAIAAIRKRNT
jgi:hypothetical protein